MSIPLLRTEAVSKTYRTPDHLGRLVLDHLDFTLPDGEIVAILGKSGSGKSTFLRILAGLVPPSEGIVEYRGRNVTDPVHGSALAFPGRSSSTRMSCCSTSHFPRSTC